MKNKQIVYRLENFAPSTLAEQWDKIGLMLGSMERECSGVLLCLDLTLEVCREAVKEGCNFIVTHHPFFFKPIDKIDIGTAQGEIVEMLIKNDITVYSSHTNLDKAEGGIGWKLSELFDATKIESNGLGFLFYCDELSLEAFARKVALKLADKSVKVVGDPNKKIKRVFVVSGGGGNNEMYAEAKKIADVFVTGDVKHHVFIEAENDGFPVVEFSHYSSEIVALDILFDVLTPEFCDLKIIKANQQCPYRILEEI